MEEVRSGLARTRGVEVTLDSQLATEQLNGDRERLAAALWLMLTFAVETSAQGTTVVLNTKADTSAWHASLAYDTSSTALQDPALPHVLEAFARKQACEPREAKRIAWVLALCKRVAEAHGGSFEQGEATGGDAAGGNMATLALRIPLSATAAK